MHTQIIPAHDWFFVHSDVREGNPPAVWHLAAWGLRENGQVEGLVGAGGRDAGAGVTAKLTPIPPVPGQYLHRDQLNEAERAQLGKR
ncbi:MAG TPA: hypothetical protein VM659_07535 [Dongiaceae bacterium]|nr:hypothetical protein [Dongiaceae bacterium]